MKQQYKKVPNSWKYIRRFDEPEKTIAEKAINIFSVAMYQINKHGQAILTHKVLKEITGKESRQNQRLVKQLGFIFNSEFSRCFVEYNKKYNDAYKFTLKETAEQILENPEEYFANYKTTSSQKCLDVTEKDQVKKIKTSSHKNNGDQDKNVRISSQKCLDIQSKMSASPESLYIYNKNKYKINNKINNLDNLSSNSIEKSVETAECKNANSEYVETSNNGLAKEEFVQSTQDKISAKEDVAAYTPKQQNTLLANQTPSNSEQDVGDYYPMLLKNFPLTDRIIEEVLCKSNKPNYTIGKVRLIVRNILETTPNKPVYGGKTGLVKYLVQAVNNHIEYDNSDYTTNIFQKKHLTAEEQRIVDESWTSGKIKWFPC